MKILTIPVLIVVLFLGLGLQKSFAQPEGEVLLRLRPSADPASFLESFSDSRRARSTIRYERPVSNRFHVHLLTFDPQREDSTRLLRQLRDHPLVAAAQFNYRVQQRVLPNDPEYERQWSLDRIQAPEIWDITTGGETVRGDEIVVAILDSGYDIDHEDIRDNIWINHEEIPGDKIDNDNNGYVDDITGWNFIDSSAVHRTDEHGLSVSGIIGAEGDNGLGVTGINWNIRLMLFEVLFVDQIVAAYDYVIDQRERYNLTDGREGAFVVATNASIGIDEMFCNEQPVWGAMYDLLGAVGVLTGAGPANRAWDVEEVGDMPTTCPSEFLVTVLNTNEEDEKHPGSAWGQISIDMGAPGQNSYTPKPNDRYGSFNGNSAAIPHMTGAIALLYSLPCEFIAESAINQPAQTALQIKDILLRGGDLMPGLERYTATSRRLNLFNSVDLIEELCAGTTGPLALLSVYPNPADEFVQIEYETPDFELYTFRVFNALGQQVYFREVEPSRFSQKKLNIPVSNWATGLYVVMLNRGDSREVSKFLVHP